MEKNKAIKTILIIVGLLAAFIIGGIIATPLEPTVEDEVHQNQPTLHESEWRADFVEGCLEEGATEEECSCMYDWFRNHYTIGEMVEIGVDLESEASQKVLLEVAAACYE